MDIPANELNNIAVEHIVKAPLVNIMNEHALLFCDPLLAIECLSVTTAAQFLVNKAQHNSPLSTRPYTILCEFGMVRDKVCSNLNAHNQMKIKDGMHLT